MEEKIEIVSGNKLLYKSSIIMVCISYLIYFILTIIFFSGIIWLLISLDSLLKFCFLILFIWCSIWLVLILKSIKYIKVCDDNIIIKLINKNLTIDYKDIVVISHFSWVWFNDFFVLKYIDKGTGKSKYITSIAEIFSRKEILIEGVNSSVSKKMNMVNFIRFKISKINPIYLREEIELKVKHISPLLIFPAGCIIILLISILFV